MDSCGQVTGLPHGWQGNQDTWNKMNAKMAKGQALFPREITGLCYAYWTHKDICRLQDHNDHKRRMTMTLTTGQTRWAQDRPAHLYNQLGQKLAIFLWQEGTDVFAQILRQSFVTWVNFRSWMTDWDATGVSNLLRFEAWVLGDEPEDTQTLFGNFRTLYAAEKMSRQ